jgi:hypothetical protein
VVAYNNEGCLGRFGNHIITLALLKPTLSLVKITNANPHK